MADIKGTVADGFGKVADAFGANFDQHDELGAAFALYVDGEMMDTGPLDRVLDALELRLAVWKTPPKGDEPTARRGGRKSGGRS